MCDAATSQTSFSGPDTTNHCYINNVCVPTGVAAAGYRRYHSASVCEQCQPSVNPTDYSPTPGFIHDRDLVNSQNPGGGGRAGAAANVFGMMFESRSNGCQMLPSLTLGASSDVTDAKTVASAAAMVVSGDIAMASSRLTHLAHKAGHEAHLEEE